MGKAAAFMLHNGEWTEKCEAGSPRQMSLSKHSFMPWTLILQSQLTFRQCSPKIMRHKGAWLPRFLRRRWSGEGIRGRRKEYRLWNACKQENPRTHSFIHGVDTYLWSIFSVPSSRYGTCWALWCIISFAFFENRILSFWDVEQLLVKTLSYVGFSPSLKL